MAGWVYLIVLAAFWSAVVLVVAVMNYLWPAMLFGGVAYALHLSGWWYVGVALAETIWLLVARPWKPTNTLIKKMYCNVRNTFKRCIEITNSFNE